MTQEKEKNSETIEDIITNTLFGDKKDQEEFKPQSDAQHAEVPGDMPNSKIRLDKMRDQRDNARKNNNDLANRLSELKGKLSVHEDKDKSDDNDTDPTEYMDDSTKVIYEQNKNIKSEIAELMSTVSKMKQGESVKNLEEQENRFFDNKPELKDKRQEVVDDLLNYLKEKPKMKEMLLDKQLTINQVYASLSASRPSSLKQSEVSNPGAVFSGQSNSAPSALEVSQKESNHRKALSILKDKTSVNKREATEFLQSGIVDDIIGALG